MSDNVVADITLDAGDADVVVKDDATQTVILL